MYKRMVVLLDGSKLAEVVFSYARELSGRLNLNLDLLHVCSSREAEQLPMHQAYVEHMAEMLKAQAEETHDKVVAKPGNEAIEVRGKVVIGYPAEEILKYADENSIDIIMLSTHGSSGIRRWGLGSVADKVIHGAKVPVWLVPAKLHEGILYDTLGDRLILVPLDGSKQAESVLPHVEALIKQREAETEILLISVAKQHPATSVTPQEREQIGKDVWASRTTGEIYLEKIVKKLRGTGFKVQSEQLVGDPPEEIIRYAAKYHPRLIAMTTHGYSLFNHFVFGTVTEHVLHRLHKTPLFLVRPQD